MSADRVRHVIHEVCSCAATFDYWGDTGIPWVLANEWRREHKHERPIRSDARNEREVAVSRPNRARVATGTTLNQRGLERRFQR